MEIQNYFIVNRPRDWRYHNPPFPDQSNEDCVFQIAKQIQSNCTIPSLFYCRLWPWIPSDSCIRNVLFLYFSNKKLNRLESYGRDGNIFFISFSPSEYGKIKSGKLIIETEEFYWSYFVKGTLPIYNSPQMHAKVNSGLDTKFPL